MCTLDLHARMGSQTWAQSATLKWPASPQQCTQHTLGMLPRASLMLRALMEQRRGSSGTVSTVLNDTRLFVMSCLTFIFLLVFFTFALQSPFLSCHPSAQKTQQTNKKKSLSSRCLVQIQSSQAASESCSSLIIASISSEHRCQPSPHIRKCRWRHTQGARQVSKVSSGQTGGC